jgi:membrane protease YdiL (CAAX protease family)
LSHPAGYDASNAIAAGDRSPRAFFLLVFALSLPFYMAGALIPLQLLPGLPVSALALVCPMTAALILLHRESGAAGAIQLLQRSFDYKRIKAKVWYAQIIFLTPAATLLMYGLMRVMRSPLPTPRFPLLGALAMFMAFFAGALGEELGWSGYALDPMQARWGALQASLILGLILAIWHCVPLIEAHRSPAWIAWWSLGTVASRVLMTWIYNNTGKSVFGAALFHAMSNLSWQMFPNQGSHWDPRINGLIAACAATIVTLVWGPRTLARFKNA